MPSPHPGSVESTATQVESGAARGPSSQVNGVPSGIIVSSGQTVTSFAERVQVYVDYDDNATDILSDAGYTPDEALCRVQRQRNRLCEYPWMG